MSEAVIKRCSVKKDVLGNFAKNLSEEKMSTENFVGEKFRHWKSNFPLLTDDFFFFFFFLPGCLKTLIELKKH